MKKVGSFDGAYVARVLQCAADFSPPYALLTDRAAVVRFAEQYARFQLDSKQLMAACEAEHYQLNTVLPLFECKENDRAAKASFVKMMIVSRDSHPNAVTFVPSLVRDFEGKRDPENIGYLLTKRRKPLMYGSKLCFDELMQWLRARRLECIVCYKEVDVEYKLMNTCSRCYTHVCSRCLVDMAFVSGKRIGGFDTVLCPNCRKIYKFQLDTLCAAFRNAGDFPGDFTREKVDLVETYARKCEVRQKEIRRVKKTKGFSASAECGKSKTRHCENCLKQFWDKLAFKRAPKCKVCKVAAYCSLKCLQSHSKEHRRECAPKTRRRKQRRRQPTTKGSEPPATCHK